MRDDTSSTSYAVGVYVRDGSISTPSRFLIIFHDAVSRVYGVRGRRCSSSLSHLTILIHHEQILCTYKCIRLTQPQVYMLRRHTLSSGAYLVSESSQPLILGKCALSACFENCGGQPMSNCTKYSEIRKKTYYNSRSDHCLAVPTISAPSVDKENRLCKRIETTNISKHMSTCQNPPQHYIITFPYL